MHWPKRPWRGFLKSSTAKHQRWPPIWPPAPAAQTSWWVRSENTRNCWFESVSFICHPAYQQAERLYIQPHCVKAQLFQFLLRICFDRFTARSTFGTYWALIIWDPFCLPKFLKWTLNPLVQVHLQVWHQVFGNFETDLPSDCSELFNRGVRVSGVYAIRPNGTEPFMAFCDMSKGNLLSQRDKSTALHFVFNYILHHN